MRRIAIFCAALLAPLSAWAQGAIQQMGPASYGQIPMYLDSGHVLATGGSPSSGAPPTNPTNPGTLPGGVATQNPGLSHCAYTGPANAPYDALCFGFDGDGNGLIKLNNVGGGSSPTLSIEINGSAYPFPGTGIGNVIGPDPTTVFEPMVWGNTIGSAALDGLGTNIAHSDTQTGPITVTTSPFTVYSNKANGINAAYIWSGINLATASTDALSLYDGMRSVVVNNVGSTTNNIEGIGAYVLNNAVAGAQGAGIGGTASGIVSEIISAIDGASSWGVNVLCTDNVGQVITSHGARSCFGSEFDLNFTSPSSSGIAYMAGGASLVQPASAIGFNCNRMDGYPGTGGIAKWNACLASTDGATFNIVNAGTNTSHAVAVASITGTVLSINSLGAFDIAAKGASVAGAGVTDGTVITAQLTGDPGKAGTYSVNNSQSVGTETIYIGLPASSQSILLSAYDATGNQSNGVIQYDGFKDLLLNADVSGGTVKLLSHSVVSASFTPGLVQFGDNGAPVHLATSQSTKPVLSACGTAPDDTGATDEAGTVSMGTGSPTGCVITFTTPYTVVPVCSVTWQGTPLASQSYAVAVDKITITQTATSNNMVDYHCYAKAGG